MRRWWLLFVAFFLLAHQAFAQTPTPQAQGVVKGYLFYTPTCPHCHRIIEEFLPKIQGKYGNSLEITLLNVQEPANYLFWVFIEDQAKIPQEYRGVPFMVIGQHILIGEVDIQQHMEEVVELYLKQGGVDYLIPPDKIKEIFVMPTPQPQVKPVHLAYFYLTGCRECDQVSQDLEYLKKRYPNLVVHAFDVQKDAPLWEWLGEKLGIPQDKRLTAPAIFVGNDYLLGKDVTVKNIEDLIDKYSGNGAEPFWENWNREEAIASILRRFQSIGLVTVATAGLVDGLNPCAFATLIFLISYLTVTGRNRFQILAVGSAFTLGVYGAYFGIGAGFLKGLQALPWLREFSKGIYVLTAAFCFALALASFRDYLKAQRGSPEEMSLKMPTRLRRVVNKVIRESMKVRYLVPLSLAIGFIISMIEFVCTGQVYLPTILFIISVPEMRVRALAYLLVYNLAFILPMVTVFLLAFWGVSSERLGLFFSQHISSVKLATFFLFLALGSWLVYAFFA
jgi:cytochrome c biogenesis protein CcdA/thiol-disulfide isomerase/thioredoxin